MGHSWNCGTGEEMFNVRVIVIVVIVVIRVVMVEITVK